LQPQILPRAYLGFPGTEAGSRLALLKLRRVLERLQVQTCNIQTTELVLGEILNNVAEHAFADGQTGITRLSVCRQRNGLVFHIVDQGKPLPGLELPKGAAPDIGTNRNSLPEGGFGWFLIRHLAKDLRYQRKGGQNILNLRILLNRHGDCQFGTS
jgi:Anti-sigma regulatory factor (Ser/Thr protein kinase)